MANDTPKQECPASMRLFVVGSEPHSLRARENLERVLADLHSECEVEVTDVLKNYKAALDNGVLIAPTLIITTESSRITIAGDMSDTSRLKAALLMV